MNCPYCGADSTPIGCGDEVIDFCGECGRVIEGEELEQLNAQQEHWWTQMDQDEQWIEENL